uniref:Origin recognition complex subunit 5 n=1 Tax=Panagrellus redivivus TaxID=6233 RepID=A0A7E4ZUG8_PANRE
MDPDAEIFKAILRPGLNHSGVQHVHVVCRDKDQMDDFYTELSDAAVGSSGFVSTTTCLFIGENPYNLFKLILEAVTLTTVPPVRNVAAFLNSFRKSIDALNKPEEFVTVCLKHAELLRNVAASPFLEHLFHGFGDEWLSKRLRIVTLSTIPWDLILVSDEVSPSVLHTVYKQKTTVEKKHIDADVMRLQYKALDEDAPEIFCQGFAKFCVKNFKNNTTDPHHLLFLISKVAGIVKDKTDPTDENFKKDVVKNAMHGLKDDFVFLKVDNSCLETVADPVNEIPYYARFVLVAAYCASYNRKTSDLRYFARERDGKRRTAHKTKAETNTFQETGPQTFSLPRLLGMVCFFMSDYLKYTDPIPDIQSLINQLCSTKLIVRTSSDVNLQKPKYRCEASYDRVVQVARSLDINLADFLESDPSTLTAAMPLISLT